jgi:iron(III) transport system substrate-binding protein
MVTRMPAVARAAIAAALSVGLAASLYAARVESLSEREWNRMVAAAKTEGRVVVAGPPGVQWRQAAMAFEAAYPDVKLEFLGGGGRDHLPRLMAERRGGQYHWDVIVTGSGSAIPLKAEAALDPLAPALIKPGVADDRAWLGGFADGWMDKERKFIYGFMGEASPEVYVNRKTIGEKELNSVEQLVDRRWRGRITWNDPRLSGSGSLQAANLLYLFGKGFLTKLLGQVVPVTDLRQQVDWIVRGTYPIAISLDYRFLAEFQKQGVGRDVVPLGGGTPASGAFRLSPGFGCVALLNRAPHPNAARVFINWLLSKEGQDAHVRATDVNSRRLDAMPGREAARPVQGRKYINLSKEDTSRYLDEAIAIARTTLN